MSLILNQAFLVLMMCVWCAVTFSVVYILAYEKNSGKPKKKAETGTKNTKVAGIAKKN